MTEPASPRAARLGRPSWFDARLLLGVLLILVAVVAGARVFAAADDDSPLYVAAHPLVPGEHLTAADVTTAPARLEGEAGKYLSAAGGPPVGYVVQRYVGAGELLPAAAVVPRQQAAPDRLVPLPVAPGHLPPDIGPGSLVDVYASAKAVGGSPAAPVLVARAVPVEQRSGGTSGLGGSSTLTVVVAVPAAEVSAVVRAVEGGAIDVVGVPAAASASARPAAGSAASAGASRDRP